MKVQELVKMDMMHIHRLAGFFVGKDVYTLQITSKKERTPRGILVNRVLQPKQIKTIKMFVHHDLTMYDKYDKDNTYYVTLEKIPQVQKAGAYFPLRITPYACNDVIVEVNATMAPFYSEPAIEYVKLSGATTYNEFISFHRSLMGNSYFNFVADILSPGDFPNYKSILLTHHLLTNKYAHNGLGTKDDLDHLFEMMQSTTYRALEIIHSFCHVYDSLYMMKHTVQFDNMIDILAEYEALIPNEMQLECLLRFINKGSGDFLITDINDQYVTPYAIKPEAIANKIRQYQSMYDVLIDSFNNQLSANILPFPTGTTRKLPNT